LIDEIRGRCPKLRFRMGQPESWPIDSKALVTPKNKSTKAGIALYFIPKKGQSCV
jgi:hypothetical protein